MEYKENNNHVEYESINACMNLSIEMGALSVKARSDSDLTAN